MTRGIALNELAGRRFMIGEVEIVGRRWCEPCAHLQRLTTPGVLRGLVHRGGLRADIVRGGTIARGDQIRPLAMTSYPDPGHDERQTDQRKETGGWQRGSS